MGLSSYLLVTGLETLFILGVTSILGLKKALSPVVSGAKPHEVGAAIV